MANPVMNTYAQVGKHEEVADEISMISPTATPMLTMIGSEKIDNTLYQWQEDALDAPAVNAAIEGAVAPAANQVPTNMRSNTTQIFTKTVSTTGSADKMKTYGRGVEFAYQLAKKGKEIKRDMEYALVGTRQSKVIGSSTTARVFDGVQAQVDPTMVLDIEVLTSTAAVQPLSEAALMKASQMAFNAGSEPTTILIKPADSILFANFANATGRLREIGSETKLVNVVNIYVTPFGQMKVVIDRWIATVDALLFDPTMWKLRPFRNWFTKPLAETGDSRQSQLLGEFGLSHRNFTADVLITNLK